MVLAGVAIYLGIEYLRWTFRPAARRVRVLDKLKSRPADSVPGQVRCDTDDVASSRLN